MSLAPYAKAITAFVTTAATTVLSAIFASSDGGTAITPTEWVSIIAVTVAATLGVFAIPNKPEGQPEA